MPSKYVENLIFTVIDNSISSTFEEATMEWDIIDCEVDEDCEGQCICGKESIKYLFRIKNRYTNSVLFPIGSTCIKKFGRSDLNSIVKVYEQMGKLYEATRAHKYIELGPELFSRNLLQAFLKLGAFEPNQWNRFNPANDCAFLLDMFNSRRTPTPAQQKKINGLLAYQIKPFIRNYLHYRN